ncbi:MAG: HAD family phosphatase [Epulopiscium sp.]|nr:HAD family phosphatase [Candidatus Epulonipiscium sp.]
MTKKKIDTVVFDLGNVLLSFNPLSYLEKKFKDHPFLDLIYEEVFKTKEWLELDRGTLEEDEFIKIISRRIPEHKEIVREIVSTWDTMLTPIQPSVDWIPKLKEKGYRLYILSNFHKRAFVDISNKYDFFRYFDGKLISSHYQLLKPEKEIYAKLMELYNINPSTTLFIDDSKANVDAAQEFGFHTIHFQEAGQIEEFFNCL